MAVFLWFSFNGDGGNSFDSPLKPGHALSGNDTAHVMDAEYYFCFNCVALKGEDVKNKIICSGGRRLKWLGIVNEPLDQREFKM